MDIGNPYQSPCDVAIAPLASLPAEGATAWRDGECLVLRGPLAPTIGCALTGDEEGTVALSFELAHEPGWIGPFFWAGLLPYYILQFLFTQRRTLVLPVAQTWLDRRNVSTRWTVYLFFGGIALALLGALEAIPPLIRSPLMWLGAWCAVAGWLMAAFAFRPGFALVHAEEGLTWVSGVHPRYLAALPAWPGGETLAAPPTGMADPIP